MNEFLNNLGAAFTPTRRRVIYHVVSAAVLILTVNKVLTADEASAYLQAAGMVLGVGVAQMAAANVTEDE
jgi:hypothetical protein